MWTLQAQIPLLDELLEDHSSALGADSKRYRNHAYGVANLSSALLMQLESLAAVAVT